MTILFAIIFIPFGIFSLVAPESLLDFSNLLTLKGPRTYTWWAILSTRVSGVLLILAGIFLIVVNIFFYEYI